MNNTPMPEYGLEDTLDTAWDDVMERFNNPSLDTPKLDNTIDTAAITMKDHKVSINRNFVEELKGKGLQEYDVVKSLLMHEVNHYMHCPFELRNYLKMLEMTKRHSKRPQEVCNYYMDVIVNLDLLMDKNAHRDEHIAEIYRVLEKDSEILRLTVGIYEKYIGKDLGSRIVSGIGSVIDSGNKLAPYLDKLLSIDYFDESRWVENAGRFAQIMKDFIPEEQKEKNPLGDITAKSYSPSEQKQALKELAEALDPKAFRKHIRDEQLQITNITPSVEYYDIQSKKFPIQIIPKAGKINELDEHKKWSVEDPISEIDIFNSYGKIFPGMTQSWKASSSIQPGRELPDLFLAIDSSGSMTPPHISKSLAVLSAFCLAKNYLANNRLVATYNFSDTTKYTDFSNKKELFKNLTYYTAGFTESFNPSEVTKKIGNRYCDIVICSDMVMANIDDVMSYLSQIKNVNRVSLLCIDDAGEYSSLSKTSKDIADSGIYTHIIRTEDDIKNIIIGNMSGYVAK